jgi:hypothetical protein
MWIFGGYVIADGHSDASGPMNDVWNSTDGKTWTKVTDSASWSPRQSHVALVYDNKMWIFGGTLMNDVWNSTDGKTWTKVTDSASWSPRQGHVALVYDGKMWIFGGGSMFKGRQNDVWNSTDGKTWTKVTDSADWSKRSFFISAIFDSKMWVFGGSDDSGPRNDVWSSVDGKTWTKVTDSAGWSPRYGCSSTIYDNEIWIMGGGPLTPFYKNDVWYSGVMAPIMASELTWTSSTQNIVLWTSIHDAISYIVECDDNQNFSSPTTATVSSSMMNHTFASLKDGQKYWYRVQTVDGQGNMSDWSNVVCSTQDASAPSTTVVSDGADVSFVESISFTWPASTDPNSGSGIANYEVQIGTSPNASDLFIGKVGNVLKKTMTCPFGSTVFCRVRPIDKAGNIGNWSNSTDGIFIDSPPPAPSIIITPQDAMTYNTIVPSLGNDQGKPAMQPIIGYNARLYCNGVLKKSSGNISDTYIQPYVAKKSQRWEWRVKAQDRFGAWSQDGITSITILDSPPTQPLVEIRPTTPTANNNLIAYITRYSVDPDTDDSVGYYFQWYVSSNGGTTFTHKAELDGSPMVAKEYIQTGEVWKFICTPYEKIPMKPDLEKAASAAAPLQGNFGWNQVYVGNNKIPSLTIKSCHAATYNNTVRYTIKWAYNDPEGQSCKVQFYWSKTEFFSLTQLSNEISAKNGLLTGYANLPKDHPFYLYGVITDSKGAVNHSAIFESELQSAAKDWFRYQ